MLKKHYPLIRTIYLYLFTLIGLGLLIYGGISFINMGLRAFVFTMTDEQERIIHFQPPMPWDLPISTIEEEIEKKEQVCLTEEQKVRIEHWLITFKNWEERRIEIDPIAARRHREASTNLSVILIGLPLYLYHWQIIKKETKNREEE